jgi:biopolymer transport protein ExbB
MAKTIFPTSIRSAALIAIAASLPLAAAEGEGPLAVASSYIEMGGSTMIALAVLSIAALAFLIERLARRDRIVPAGLADTCRDLWAKKDFKTLMTTCTESKSSLGRAIYALAEYRHATLEHASMVAADVATGEIRPHIRATRPFAVVATISPLVGLFGTIIGMIGAFSNFRLLGETGDPGVFAGDISKALVTTAGGLVIAVPTLAIYHWIKSRTTKMADDLESQVNELTAEWFLGKVKDDDGKADSGKAEA